MSPRIGIDGDIDGMPLDTDNTSYLRAREGEK
jgi:hypothetical protein